MYLFKNKADFFVLCSPNEIIVFTILLKWITHWCWELNWFSGSAGYLFLYFSPISKDCKKIKKTQRNHKLNSSTFYSIVITIYPMWNDDFLNQILYICLINKDVNYMVDSTHFVSSWPADPCSSSIPDIGSLNFELILLFLYYLSIMWHVIYFW